MYIQGFVSSELLTNSWNITYSLHLILYFTNTSYMISIFKLISLFSFLFDTYSMFKFTSNTDLILAEYINVYKNIYPRMYYAMLGKKLQSFIKKNYLQSVRLVIPAKVVIGTFGTSPFMLIDCFNQLTSEMTNWHSILTKDCWIVLNEFSPILFWINKIIADTFGFDFIWVILRGLNIMKIKCHIISNNITTSACSGSIYIVNN